MTKLMEAYVDVRADDSRLHNDLTGVGKGVQQRMSIMGNAAGVALGNLISAGIQTGIRTGLSAVSLAGHTVKMASDAEEAASKFGFVFGEAASKTEAAIDRFAKSAGRSRFALRSMAADVGALAVPMGYSQQAAGELSEQFTKLAVDLSSFHNVSESDALLALRSALVGQSEPMRRFGVVLNEDRIKAEAFARGLVGLKEEMSPLARAQAVVSLVMKQTAAAHGDAERTADSYANTVRRMQAQFSEVGMTIGRALLPVMTELAGLLTEIGELFNDAIIGKAPALKAAIGGFAAVFDELSLAIVDWKTTWEMIKTSAELRLIQIADRAAWLWDQLKAGTVGLVKGFISAFAEIISNWRTLIMSMLDVFLAFGAGVGEGLKEMFTGGGFDGFADAFNAQIDEAVAHARQEFAKVGEAFGDAFRAEMQGAAFKESPAAKDRLKRLDQLADQRIQNREQRRQQRDQQQAAAAPPPAKNWFNDMVVGAELPKKFGEWLGKASGAVPRGIGAAAALLPDVGAGQPTAQAEKPRSEFVALSEMSKRIQSGLTGDPAEKRQMQANGLLAKIVDGVNSQIGHLKTLAGRDHAARAA